ncbi:MAG: hypothetical protein ACJAZ0_000264 [Halioglobus sp.]|jgi:hypothetical protein
MNIIKLSAFALILAGANASAEDCVGPGAPVMPDGASSTMSQMIEGQKAVKSFQAANIEYMNCVEARMTAEEADDSEKSTEAHTASVEEFNAAVSAEETVAGQFNIEIRAYKEANPK